MANTIYIAIIEDRHTDVEVWPFSTAEAAIEYAKRCALNFAYDPDDLEEEEIEGWLYYVRYSAESESVHVVAKELDATQ